VIAADADPGDHQIDGRTEGVLTSMSRDDRLRLMHERRLVWTPTPRCPECGRAVTAMVVGSVPCERCLTVAGDMVADTSATVTATSAAAVSDPDLLVERTRAIPSIWNARLRPGGVTARIASGSVQSQPRGWFGASCGSGLRSRCRAVRAGGVSRR
jgi:hypothetical protein